MSVWKRLCDSYTLFFTLKRLCRLSPVFTLLCRHDVLGVHWHNRAWNRDARGRAADHCVALAQQRRGGVRLGRDIRRHGALWRTGALLQ